MSLFRTLIQNFMEFPPDFITESEDEETQDHVFINDQGIFLTTSNAKPFEKPKRSQSRIVPEETRPLADLSKNLVSHMQGLMLFGSSELGTTIEGSAYDLGKKLENLIDTFPHFFVETGAQARSSQSILEQKFDLAKEKLEKAKEVNRKLKNYIRQINNNMPKDTGSAREREFTRASNDMRTTSLALKKTIEKLRDIHQATRELQIENAHLQQKCDKLLQSLSHDEYDEVGTRKAELVRTEIELRNLIAAQNESYQRMQANVDNVQQPVNLLKKRLQDLEKRISMCGRKAPLKRGNAPYHPSTTSKKMPRIAVPYV